MLTVRESVNVLVAVTASVLVEMVEVVVKTVTVAPLVTTSMTRWVRVWEVIVVDVWVRVPLKLVVEKAVTVFVVVRVLVVVSTGTVVVLAIFVWVTLWTVLVVTDIVWETTVTSVTVTVSVDMFVVNAMVTMPLVKVLGTMKVVVVVTGKVN